METAFVSGDPQPLFINLPVEQVRIFSFCAKEHVSVLRYFPRVLFLTRSIGDARACQDRIAME